MSGFIPKSIGNLTNLKLLSLGEYLAEMGALMKLNRLSLVHCNFAESIVPSTLQLRRIKEREKEIKRERKTVNMRRINIYT